MPCSSRKLTQHRGFPARKTRFANLRIPAILFFIVDLSGCAPTGLGARHADLDGPQFILDSRFCQSVAARNVNVRLNTGVGMVKLDGGTDERLFGVCMIERGWGVPVSTEVVAAIAACRTETQRTTSASRSPRGARIGTASNADAFAQCLGERGVRGKVIVGPVQPASGF